MTAKLWFALAVIAVALGVVVFAWASRRMGIDVDGETPR